MKYLFNFFIAVFFSLSAFSQNKATGDVANLPNKASDILTLQEMEYDFGKIPQGKPVTHVFEVVNNGTDSLRISNVQASCGCTTPEWERNEVVAPGGKTSIKVGYNAANAGSFTKTITIFYNQEQTKQISIKGEVWKTPINSAPENNDLENLNK